MNDHIRNLREFVKDSVQQPVRQRISAHSDDGHFRGFTSAANITLRRIQERLDALKEHRKGPGLTEVELALHTQLDELKSDIESDCDRYWRGSGIDWHPLKPVAKAVDRRTGASLEEEQNDAEPDANQ